MMTRKTDSPSKRLAKSFKPGDLSAPLRRILGMPETNWANVDQRTRAVAANNALTLTDHPTNEPLRLAFEAFGLDARNPNHWRTLVDLFAWAHFGRRRPGRPRRTKSFLPLLKVRADRIAAVVAKLYPGATLRDRTLFRLLKMMHPDDYPMEPGTLGKYLREARQTRKSSGKNW
jgi:hypothetical protein